MSAKPKPDRDPDDRIDLFIANHQSQYSEAISNARNAAETTATTAWQTRFAECMKDHRDLIAARIRSIRGSIEIMRTEEPSEEIEKDIRDAVKQIAEERIRHTAWWNRAVMPYQNAADACRKMIDNIIHAADEAEKAAPLMDRGLAGAVRDRLAKWPKAEWDEDAGAVIIHECKE